jgi:ABC-type nitrate/sulfonate/bicarbonate transport system substrate-binding protein
LATDIGWAISTGAKRTINSVEDLKNGKIGASRIGSGSYVMGFVLADEQGWLSSPSTPPFEVITLQTFDKLRAAVNDSSADFFMWEHFTSKRYYDNGEIKKIGEIYTPWSSWKIVARTDIEQSDQRLEEMFEKIDKGVRYFEGNREESVRYISGKLDYSEEDAREWLKTVKFARSTKGVDVGVIQKTVGVLRKAGVLGEKGMKPEQMIASQRGAQVP